MKITSVNVLCLPMSYSWLTERLIANPMAAFSQYKEKRSSWFGKMVAGVVQISTDEGITGPMKTAKLLERHHAGSRQIHKYSQLRMVFQNLVW